MFNGHIIAKQFFDRTERRLIYHICATDLIIENQSADTSQRKEKILEVYLELKTH